MMILQVNFVDLAPEFLEEGNIYVSIKYKSAIHKCVCGCGNEVLTPFSPNDWQITYDGETISLYPSICNLNFECKSHYWITRNKVIQAREWGKNRHRLKRKKKC
jgi:hypothetical protein